MLFYNTLHGVYAKEPSAVALGFFDGLHKGHQAVITQAVTKRAEGFLPTVFTFTMQLHHPDKKPDQGYELITRDDKCKLLAKMGVQVTVCPDFAEFRDMDAQTFVAKVLKKRLNACHVFCGRDFRFGKRASADINTLTEICSAQGIIVDPVEEITEHEQRVSSTWIRKLLGDGDVEQAEVLLGRPFGYDFAVVEGKKLGRTLDFPTINQPIPKNFVAMRRGVYVSTSYVMGKWYPSVTNIGVRPTVENSDALNSETFICGFSGDLYGARVPVNLLSFIRPEQKFDSLEQLRLQIAADAVKACAIATESLKNPAY